MGTMKAPPSGAYKIVSVPELYGDLIRAKGVEGTYVGSSEAESPWVPFGDNAAIRHLAFDVRENVYVNVLWIKGPGVIGTHKHRGKVWAVRARRLVPLPRVRLGVPPRRLHHRDAGHRPHARHRRSERHEGAVPHAGRQRVLRRERQPRGDARRVVVHEPLRDLLPARTASPSTPLSISEGQVA